MSIKLSSWSSGCIVALCIALFATSPLAQDEPTSHPTSQPTDEVTVAGLEVGESAHFGAEFAIEGDAVSLQTALAECVGTETPCKVEGTIDAVCQRSGCWFTMAAPDVEFPVRIRMLDYGFFVPRDARGQHVVLEGVLNQEELSEEMAQHYLDDAAQGSGEPAPRVEGPQQQYQFMISGAHITRVQ